MHYGERPYYCGCSICQAPMDEPEAIGFWIGEVDCPDDQLDAICHLHALTYETESEARAAAQTIANVTGKPCTIEALATYSKAYTIEIKPEAAHG